MLKIKTQSNYLAKVFKISNLRKHTNADRLQCTSVDGFNVITGLDAKMGDIYVYFPTECAINSSFLSATNSFRHGELNANKEAKGFFEDNCRVKALKLRNEKSEGYIVPAHSVEAWLSSQKIEVNLSDYIGEYFDCIGNITVCEKYINRDALRKLHAGNRQKQHKKVRESKIIPNQFRFHYDTEHLGRHIHELNPNDLLSITYKIHGTSAIISKVLCKKKLGIISKVLKFFKVDVCDTHYDLIYSSRGVVKNQYADQQKEGFYDADVWGIIANRVKDLLPTNVTLYGEIVGYTPSGSFIQKHYDYGCDVGTMEFYVYRITFTGYDGQAYDFSWQQVKDFCNQRGLKHVEEFYYGRLSDLFPAIKHDDLWGDNVLQALAEKYLERKCHICKNDVWGEGIVLKKDGLNTGAYKLKSFNFTQQESKEADSGEVDLETQESFTEGEQTNGTEK